MSLPQTIPVAIGGASTVTDSAIPGVSLAVEADLIAPLIRELVKFLFVVGGQEVLSERHALGEFDVLEDLFAEGAGADAGEALFEAEVADGFAGVS